MEVHYLPISGMAKTSLWMMSLKCNPIDYVIDYSRGLERVAFPHHRGRRRRRRRLRFAYGNFKVIRYANFRSSTLLPLSLAASCIPSGGVLLQYDCHRTVSRWDGLFSDSANLFSAELSKLWGHRQSGPPGSATCYPKEA